MDAIAEASTGLNIIAEPKALPPYYPAPTVDPAGAEVFWQQLDANNNPVGVPVSLGTFAPGATGAFPFNPNTDGRIRLYSVSHNAAGVPSVREISHGVQADLSFNRVTEAPTVTLIGAATNTLIQLEVDGFSSFAQKRKVRRSPNADMSGATEEITDYTNQEMPRVVNVTRETTPAAQTIYVRISHSGGEAFGAESPAQPFTFAANDGTGGSSGGGGGYYKRDQYEL